MQEFSCSFLHGETIGLFYADGVITDCGKTSHALERLPSRVLFSHALIIEKFAIDIAQEFDLHYEEKRFVALVGIGDSLLEKVLTMVNALALFYGLAYGTLNELFVSSENTKK